MKLLPAFTTTQHPDLSAFTNRVFCADALELLGALPDASVDMGMTSPPYDNLRTYNGFTWDFEAIAKETYRVLKPGGVLVWVVGDATIDGSETLTSMRQALYFVDVCGFKMNDTMIWQKKGLPAKQKTRYMPDFEYMFVLSKGDVGTFNCITRENKKAGQTSTKGHSGKNGWEGACVRIVPNQSPLTNLWYVQVGNNHTTKDGFIGSHPAMFPEELARRHIHTWSNEGDTVLDFFMGSGTTAKMARKLGRKYIGCDISQEYVDLARQRIQTTDPYRDTILPDGTKQLSLFSDQAS